MMANPVHGIPDVCLGRGEFIGIAVTITSSSTTTTSSSDIFMFIDRRRSGWNRDDLRSRHYQQFC